MLNNYKRRCTNISIFPKGTMPRAYFACVLGLTIAFTIAESYILYLTRMGYNETWEYKWKVPGVEDAAKTSLTSFVVYNVLLIIAQFYAVFLCTEALARQNTIQAIVIVAFYVVCLAYAATRYIAMYVYPTLAAHIFSRNQNMYTIQAVVVAMYSIALVALVVMSYKLKKDMGWTVFKKLGADASLHRAYKWHQCLMMALKLDIYFVGSYLVQMTVLVLKANDVETWLQISLFIPFCIVVVVAAYYALTGEHRRLMIAVVCCMFVFIGYFIFKISQVCRPDIIGKPGDPYNDSRPFLMITIVVCMLLVIATGLISVMCIRQFGSGLRESIVHDKQRKLHARLYGDSDQKPGSLSNNEEMVGLLTPSDNQSQKISRERRRFALE